MEVERKKLVMGRNVEANPQGGLEGVGRGVGGDNCWCEGEHNGTMYLV